MQCPACHSEISPGVKYCQTCGTDVESALQSMHAAPAADAAQAAYQQQYQQSYQAANPVYQAPQYQTQQYQTQQYQQAPQYTQGQQYVQAPQYQQPAQYQEAPQQAQTAQQAQPAQTAYYPDQTQQQPAMRSSAAPAQGGRGRGSAVPINSSMPATSTMREFDMSEVKKAPKWPVVLIVILVLAIIAALLFLFKPWESILGTTSGDEGQGTVATTATTEGQATVDGSEAGEQGEQANVEDASATAATVAATATTDAETFQTLSDYYGQLSGFDTQISETATAFNAHYLDSDQSVRADYAAAASNVLSLVTAALDQVKALALPETSVYYTDWGNVMTLYECLVNRANVLSQAWAVSAAASNPSDASVTSQISAILGADNNESGVNIYKAQYEQLYPTAQPVEK